MLLPAILWWGVSISVKNSPGTGTITDLDGKFSIEVSNNTELTFSYIGYKQQVLSVGDLGVLKVKMQSDNEVLDEVVVVGAGTQKKSIRNRCYFHCKRCRIACTEFFTDQ